MLEADTYVRIVAFYHTDITDVLPSKNQALCKLNHC